MADKKTKTKQKALATDIVSSIEARLGEAGQSTKKIKKSIEKSAEKLAKKLTKLMFKDEKKKAKPEKSADKKAKKVKGKGKKNGQMLTNPQASKTLQADPVNPAPKPASLTQPVTKPVATKPATSRSSGSASSNNASKPNAEAASITTAEGAQ